MVNELGTPSGSPPKPRFYAWPGLNTIWRLTGGLMAIGSLVSRHGAATIAPPSSPATDRMIQSEETA